jgi:photosystem II stability/assembly factor-like uncharacterized protein
VAPSDTNIVYVGTGEGCLRGDISYGDGVYRSNDAGKTWKNIGLKDTRHIPRVLVDPHNPDIVLVAALGHAFAPNSERGVYPHHRRRQDWTKVSVRRRPDRRHRPGYAPGNPLSSSRPCTRCSASRGPSRAAARAAACTAPPMAASPGSNWKATACPDGVLGKIGVSVSGADPSRVYALIEAEKGGLYRSDDGGDKWERTNDDERYRQRAWYFSHVFADPRNADTVYVLNTGMFRSTDAGKTFTLLPAPHGDHHGLWIDPTNPQRMINGDDGGATISIDGGKNWTPQLNQPTAQFYHVATDNRFPYYVFGAQQDNTARGHASVERFRADRHAQLV